MQCLRDVRSGDISLLANHICVSDATGYYFGQPLPGWHGSLCASDLTVPIIFSFPHGYGQALARFASIVDDPSVGLPQPGVEARITGAHRKMYELPTRESP